MNSKGRAISSYRWKTQRSPAHHAIPIAIFGADTLEFLALKCLSQQPQAPWVAVDPLGNLYSSGNQGSMVSRYSVDWPKLKSQQELTLTNEPPVTLLNEQGNSLTLNSFQGGVISPSGQLMYIVADGIHVFDLQTGRRIQSSKNGSGHFNYEFDPSLFDAEEPEGITIWDLDDGWAPNIRGQLHVLLLNNDWPDDDNVYLKHYSGTICVNGAYSGEEKGTPSKPFKTVGRANDLVNSAAWDGAQIKIWANSYPETLTFSRRIKVLAEAGTAIIGRSE